MSSGKLKYRGSRRISLPAAVSIARQIFFFLKERVNRKYKINFLMKTPGDRFLNGAYGYLSKANFKIPYHKRLDFDTILFALKVAHNGVRKRKMRRV